MATPYGRHHVDENDVAAVLSVLNSEYLTQGPAVRDFEVAVAHRVGAAFAVAANSATSALHLACLALGVTERDNVWTSAITFVASANCARYCGANVDFIDIDPETWTMSAAALEIKLREAEKEGRLPKVVIPVHLAGNPCDMAAIGALAREFGFRIIEDASHALGATTAGGPVGSCLVSDIVVFSFHPVKMITSAEGGMATTNDERLFNAMVRLRSHGITRAPEEMRFSSDGPWYYEQLELGLNYRMPDLLAVLGRSQLGRLEKFVEERQRLHAIYLRELAETPVSFQAVRETDISSRHLEIVRLELDSMGTTQREVFERLRSRGLLVNLHYIPVYRHPYYRALLPDQPECPEAERYYQSAITLPLYFGLREAEIREVCVALTQPIGHQTIF